MIPLLLIGLLAADAPEHALPEVALPDVTRSAVPVGAPVDVRLAPGADVQAAVHAAPAGSTLRLAAGVHRAPLFVDRPLTLVGEPGAALLGTGRGSVLVIAADDVVVRDLAVRGSGADPHGGDAGVVVHGRRIRLERLSVEDALAGVDVRSGADIDVVGCRIRGRADLSLSRRGDGIRVWEVDRARLVGNVLIDTRDLVIWFSRDVLVAGNVIAHGRYGTHLMYATGVEVRGNAYEDDVVGVFVMYSRDVAVRRNLVRGSGGAAGTGLGFKESDDVAVADNTLVANTTGILLDATPRRFGASAAFERNLLGGNVAGLRLHTPAPGVVFRGNMFHENRAQVVRDDPSATGAVFEGNAWSDYAGYDLDRDGIGDVPYAPRAATAGLRAREPMIAFFEGTLAASLLDLIAATFPLAPPRPILTDPRPTVGGSR